MLSDRIGLADLVDVRQGDATNMPFADASLDTERISKEGVPPPGFRVLLGPDFAAKAQNQRHHLEEARIVLARIVARG